VIVVAEGEPTAAVFGCSSQPQEHVVLGLSDVAFVGIELADDYDIGFVATVVVVLLEKAESKHHFVGNEMLELLSGVIGTGLALVTVFVLETVSVVVLETANEIVEVIALVFEIVFVAELVRVRVL